MLRAGTEVICLNLSGRIIYGNYHEMFFAFSAYIYGSLKNGAGGQESGLPPVSFLKSPEPLIILGCQRERNEQRCSE
jgi:hypothetical protein